MHEEQALASSASNASAPQGFAEARGSMLAALDVLERAEQQARDYAADVMRRAEEQAREITADAENRVADLRAERALLEQKIRQVRTGLEGITTQLTTLARTLGIGESSAATVPGGSIGSQPASPVLLPTDSEGRGPEVSWAPQTVTETPEEKTWRPGPVADVANDAGSETEGTNKDEEKVPPKTPAAAEDPVSALRAALEKLGGSRGGG